MIEYPMKVSSRKTLILCLIKRKERDTWEILSIRAAFLVKVGDACGPNVLSSSND